MLRNGVMPIPPPRNTAARAESFWRIKSPDGPSIFTAVPIGIVFNPRLNAVSRIRVATIKVSSCGALAIKKLRTFPSESVSEGSSKVISRYWPALNVQPDGFSNRKAMVPSATSLRSFSLQLKPGDAAATLIIGLLPIRASINPRLRFFRGTAKPRESNPRLLTEILVIFPPAALALANGFVILDKLDCADVFHHRESKLRFNAQAKRRSMVDRKRLAVHFIGENRLRIFSQLQTNRAVEISRSLGVWLRCGFIIECVEDNVSSGWKWSAESYDMMQRYTAPLR